MQLIKNATKEKLRGGFYTPEPIASFILKWAFNGNTEVDILEPSCGDGVFLEEIKKGGYQYNSVIATELDTVEAKKSRQIALENSEVINTEFHQFCIKTDKRFDLIIGNPPYIRYQYFDKEQQEFASQIFKKANLKYSKLTNAWVSFVVGSSLLLKETGKIGFVLPAEILQVSYAQTLREFLAKFYNKINIVSFEKLVFPDIQQEVVLLLCEKNNSQTHLIEHLELKDAEDLQNLEVVKLKSPKKKIDFKSNKWTFYFLDQNEIDFLERLQEENKLLQLGEYAKVEVGITTGSNPFFTVPLSTVQFYNLEKYAKPLVGRSVQVPSAIFTETDWQKNRAMEARTHLLTFPKKEALNNSVGAKKYIAWGEEQEIHKGYKCRIRDEWQMVPSLRISDALFIRRNNLYPKLIINQAKAYTTDTMHRVTIKPNTEIKALTASYYNSVSLAFSEICGRSHGGGVLELMPNEVARILLPYHKNNANLLPIIDKMIRAKKDISEILKITNKKILKENYNFSDTEIALADSIWKKLSKRRLNRGKKEKV
ncbi:Modification methyltransferase [Tenacibaculum maritimum]|uniref:Eco57I restriction-modification methylase domain-containing protein n=1 Tax=Tenacibaculum maritimum TaxID=107401 RepID=UPI0012E4A51F|nr:class I SAM-dependent methyltransferase [Tenacibaculum maritimum]CAA0191759.1 Modification methyltransferase [Tenacibaculum maritimum]CAA0195474.1 Modification methyltransferase [Tenacibaculum maritimum]CAA0198520.1 Modification methyltransferase [Tenacibaculum maritimum]